MPERRQLSERRQFARMQLHARLRRQLLRNTSRRVRVDAVRQRRHVHRPRGQLPVRLRRRFPGQTVRTGGGRVRQFSVSERSHMSRSDRRLPVRITSWVMLLSCAKSHMLSASRRQPNLLHVSAVNHRQIWSVDKSGCWFVGGDDLTGALHDL